MTPLHIFLGIIVFWTVLLIIVHRFEKRLVWPYGELQEDMLFPDVHDYGARRSREVQEAGFQFLGWAPDLKGPKYRASYGFAVSPEHDCLVIIGVGTILNMKLTCTWIYSIAADGTALYSADHQSGISIDVSRHWKTQLVPYALFWKLLERHRDALQQQVFTPRPLSSSNPLADFRQVRVEHFQFLARHGLIHFTDQESQRWHYTTSGAIRLALLNYTLGMVRGVTMGKIPRVA